MRFFLFLPCLLLVPFSALADDRFNALDADKDHKVSWEEFHAVNTNMPRIAFDSIDLDKDTFISHEEWDHFINNHSTGGMPGGGIAMPPKNQTLPAQDAIPPSAPSITKPSGAGMPLLMPPSQPTAPASPVSPVVNGEQSNLPLTPTDKGVSLGSATEDTPLLLLPPSSGSGSGSDSAPASSSASGSDSGPSVAPSSNTSPTPSSPQANPAP